MNKCITFSILLLLVLSAKGQNAMKAPLLKNVKIAFVSYRTGSAEIYLMNSDGTNLEQLTNSKENNSFPYQINNRTLGFTRTDSLRNITKHQIDIYTKKEQPLVENPIRKCAKWQMPDPAKIHYAFIRSTNYSDRELFLFNTITGLEKQLTTKKDSAYAAYSINHSWSSDGKKLVFMSGKDWYNQYIRIYNVEKDTIYPITSRGYMNSGLKWLKDDSTLIANLKISGKTMYEIYSVNIQTGNLKQITTGINLHPDVSPDGEWIVFESQRHQNDGEVYIMKKDGTNQVRLTHNPNYNGRCIWFNLKDK